MLMKDSCVSLALSSPQGDGGFRHDGAGLMVETAGQTLPVVDISTTGIGLHHLERTLGERFRLVLSRTGEFSGIATECEVVERDGPLVRLIFTRPTLPLLRLIMSHVCSMSGGTSRPLPKAAD